VRGRGSFVSLGKDRRGLWKLAFGRPTFNAADNEMPAENTPDVGCDGAACCEETLAGTVAGVIDVGTEGQKVAIPRNRNQNKFSFSACHLFARGRALDDTICFMKLSARMFSCTRQNGSFSTLAVGIHDSLLVLDGLLQLDDACCSAASVTLLSLAIRRGALMSSTIRPGI